MDDAAEEIGSVNTVINTEGHLFGFNTDLDGMIGMIERAGISLTGKKVAILGTGGTSKTAYVAAKRLGASKIIKVSRTPSSPSVSYDELYSDHVDTEIIINTTPVGMYPKCDISPVDLKKFKRLSGVVDVIYNPLRTPLIVEAMNLGIPATGGLYMLVRQGVRASEIFLDTKYEDNISEVIYKKILNDKENIALIGMPSSGKTTVGKLLADLIGFKLVDTDEEIVKRCKMDIPSIFKSYGEDYFRELEENVVKEVSRESGQVISTGGGVILRQNNIDALKRTSQIVFLDRPLALLTPTDDRPLAMTEDGITELYKERYPIYSSLCDVKIDATSTPDQIAAEIQKRSKE
jgi:shikimate dehydrogenase